MSQIALGDISHTLTKNQKAGIKLRRRKHGASHAVPRSQAEALERQASYYHSNERCMDCGTIYRWAHNKYCMQCNPRKIGDV